MAPAPKSGSTLKRPRPEDLAPSCATGDIKRLKKSNEHFSIHTTPAYWDNLSKIWLTKRALRELDRRQASSITIVRSKASNIPKDIARFARHGGPRLDDLRGYSEPHKASAAAAMSSKTSSRSKRTRSTNRSSYISPSTRKTKTSAYDAAFEQHLIDNGIYSKRADYPERRAPIPDNISDIQKRLAQSRSSLSPSRFPNSIFDQFYDADESILSEPKIMSTVMPAIHGGHHEIPNEEDMLFTNLESMTNNMTVKPKPDFFDGSQQSQLDVRVQRDLDSFIIPTKRSGAPVLPNFFAEVKAPGGAADVVRRQACYDGAIGARAMHRLQNYGEPEPVYDNNAYTITSTYHGGTLKMYTSHPTAGPEGSNEYHMTQINGWYLAGNADAFRVGAAAFRNARDWTTEQRNSFITKANTSAKLQNLSAHARSAKTLTPSEQHENEDTDADNYNEDEDEDEDSMQTSFAHVPRTSSVESQHNQAPVSRRVHSTTASAIVQDMNTHYKELEDSAGDDDDDGNGSDNVNDEHEYMTYENLPAAAQTTACSAIITSSQSSNATVVPYDVKQGLEPKCDSDAVDELALDSGTSASASHRGRSSQRLGGGSSRVLRSTKMLKVNKEMGTDKKELKSKKKKRRRKF